MSPWARSDDRSNSNPKLLALTDGAYRMWHCGLVYCAANLTDGFIPDYAIPTFGVRAKKDQVAAELCRSLAAGKGPLWHEVDGGYRVHDYLDWNDSREDILAERERVARRKSDWRERKQNAPGTRSGTRSGTGDVMRSGTHPGTHQEPVLERVRDGVRNGRSTSTPSTTPDRERPEEEIQDQNQRADAHASHAVLVRLAHDVLDAVDTGKLRGEEAKDELKFRSARAGIPYTAQVVTKALDSAEVQRQRRHA